MDIIILFVVAAVLYYLYDWWERVSDRRSGAAKVRGGPWGRHWFSEAAAGDIIGMILEVLGGICVWFVVSAAVCSLVRGLSFFESLAVVWAFVVGAFTLIGGVIWFLLDHLVFWIL